MAANPSYPEARPVTTGPNHHYFGYYDKFPWDKTGQYMVCLETTFIDHPPQPGDTATVGLIDLASGNAWKPLAQTRAWNWQQGSMIHWLETAPEPWFVWVHYQDPHGPYEAPDAPPPRDPPDGHVLAPVEEVILTEYSLN